MRQGKVWNWNAISFDLPQCIKDKIIAMPFQLYGSKDGGFTTVTAYNLVRPEEEQIMMFRGKWIWKIDTLPRICHFIWLCHNNSVLVREVVALKGMECEVLCSL